jgi:serine/threonine-protein kinase RsbW
MMSTATFTGKFENLEKISALVAQAAEQVGFDDTGVYAVQLAVDEACTNIIEHAYGLDVIGTIDISISYASEKLTIVLHDHGRPFDPDSIPLPQTNLPLEEVQPRGVGIYLMRRMMDEVRFDFNKDSGNTLTMVKKK